MTPQEVSSRILYKTFQHWGPLVDVSPSATAHVHLQARNGPAHNPLRLMLEIYITFADSAFG